MLGSLPLVSVLTPCYNHETYLDDYLNSLIRQTYPNIELIIIDDASTDGSWEKLNARKPELEARFTRLVLERNPQNEGLFTTESRLIPLVRGEFFTILESDDYYKANKIEANVSYLQAHPEIGLVHSDVDYQYSTHTDYNHWAALGRVIPEGDVFEHLLYENFILTCSICCRSNLIKSIDFETYKRRNYKTSDYPMFLDLSRKTRFGYIPQSLAVYRIVKDSISHPVHRLEKHRWKSAYYQVKLDYIQQFGASPDIIERAERQYYRNLYEMGFLARDMYQFKRAAIWLEDRYPQEFNCLRQRVRRLAIRNRIVWEAIKIWKEQGES